jgi:hypothetical protein
MDNAKAMDPRVPGFFLDHGVYNVFPLCVAMSMADTIFEHRVVNLPNFVSVCSKITGFLGVLG